MEAAWVSEILVSYPVTTQHHNVYMIKNESSKSFLLWSHFHMAVKFAEVFFFRDFRGDHTKFLQVFSTDAALNTEG
jgi:hypothetical protein